MISDSPSIGGGSRMHISLQIVIFCLCCFYSAFDFPKHSLEPIVSIQQHIATAAIPQTIPKIHFKSTNKSKL